MLGRSTLSNWKPRYFQLDLHLRTPRNTLCVSLSLSFNRVRGLRQQKQYCSASKGPERQATTERRRVCGVWCSHGRYYGVVTYSSVDRGGAKHKGEVYIHFNTIVESRPDTEGCVRVRACVRALF